jgi:protein HOOK3
VASAEAAIALRQRLNETVDKLDALRKAHTELEVKLEIQSKELTIAKSDREYIFYHLLLWNFKLETRMSVNLVNKDQLEILATLRESVDQDKTSLEQDTERLRNQIKDLNDKNRMQLEQVNALLLEKVSLQSDGIGQREKMLQRERDFGQAIFFYWSLRFWHSVFSSDLRATFSGKNIPEDIKSRLLALHEENVNLKEQNKTAQEKLVKARAVRILTFLALYLRSGG